MKTPKIKQVLLSLFSLISILFHAESVLADTRTLTIKTVEGASVQATVEEVTAAFKGELLKNHFEADSIDVRPSGQVIYSNPHFVWHGDAMPLSDTRGPTNVPVWNRSPTESKEGFCKLMGFNSALEWLRTEKFLGGYYDNAVTVSYDGSIYDERAADILTMVKCGNS